MHSSNNVSSCPSFLSACTKAQRCANTLRVSSHQQQTHAVTWPVGIARTEVYAALTTFSCL